MEKQWKIVDFHSFPMLLGKSGVDLNHSPTQVVCRPTRESWWGLRLEAIEGRIIRRSRREGDQVHVVVGVGSTHLLGDPLVRVIRRGEDALPLVQGRAHRLVP